MERQGRGERGSGGGGGERSEEAACEGRDGEVVRGMLLVAEVEKLPVI